MSRIALVILLCCAALSPAADKLLKAGAATSNITPWIGDEIVGGFNPFPSKHVHDELHARCLVIDDGATRIALVVCDNVSISRECYDEAKRQIQAATGLPADRILISSTHTHSAISARNKNAVKYTPELSDYQKFVARRISDGVRRAINNLEPAQIAWGAAREERQVHNRRWHMDPKIELKNPLGGIDQVKMNPPRASKDLLKPAGVTDPEICFLSVQTKAGRPIALLANYSLHYVGGVGPADLSADYYGYFCDRIQQLLGADRLDPPFVGILSNGTSGNINNINFTAPSEKKKPYEQIKLVADQVATAVFESYKILKHHDYAELKMVQRELELAVRKPTPEQLARAKAILATPAAEAKKDKYTSMERIYADRTMLQEDAPAGVKILLQAIRVGDCGIAAIPFETFAETGLELKARSPFKPSFIMELANGGYGYLPTPEQHALGGYETWLGTNKVEINASVKITKTILDMWNELK